MRLSLLVNRLVGRLLPPLLLFLVGVASHVGWLEEAELALYDRRIGWAGLLLPPATSHVTLLGADETDLNILGWPLSDYHLATILERLAALRPRVVGIDLYRDRPRGEGAARLEAVLRQHANLVGVTKFPGEGTPAIPAHPALATDPSRTGFADLPLDPDGKVRRGLLFLDDGRQSQSSLALQLALRHLAPLGIQPTPDAEHPAWLKLGRTSLPPLEATAGGYTALDDRGYQFLLDYRESQGRLPLYSMQALLEGRIPEGEIRDRVVIVGTAAESVKDHFVTPLRLEQRQGRLVHGMELHAFAANQLLRMAMEGHARIRTLEDSVEWSWLGLWGILGAGAGLLWWRGVALVLLTGEVLLALASVAAFLFGWWLPWAAPALALPMTAAPAVALRAYEERQRRRQVEKQLVETAQERDELARQTQQLTQHHTLLEEHAQSVALDNLRTQGLWFQEQGQLDLAFDKFQRCQMDEEMATLFYHLACDYERQRQSDKARSVWQYILAWNPEYRDVAQRLASDLPVQVDGLAALSATVARAVEPGQQPTLGRYRIERELGRGAMGVVYRAMDPTIQRVVALKVLSYAHDFEDTDLAEARARFIREAEGMGRLQHPNIVTIYDAGDEADLAWLAMEFVDGRDLTPHTRRPHLLPVPQVLLIGAKTAAALDYAHAHGVVHRDIKPANILFNAQTRVIKVSDFGIARLTSERDASHTKTGIVLGTVAYMSPEQVSGRRVDGRSDLFSLGVTLYHLLTGQAPFHARDSAALLYQICHQPHLDPCMVRPDLPPCLGPIIDRAMAKDPQHRYLQGMQMARELALCLQAMKKAEARA